MEKILYRLIKHKNKIYIYLLKGNKPVRYIGKITEDWSVRTGEKFTYVWLDFRSILNLAQTFGYNAFAVFSDVFGGGVQSDIVGKLRRFFHVEALAAAKVKFDRQEKKVMPVRNRKIG